MEWALNPDVLMQFLRGFFSVYIQVAKMKTALTWLHISLMNSSDYCIQANPSLACAFVLCSDLRPVFLRTCWNTVSSQVDTIVGNTDDLQCNQNREQVYDFMNKLAVWTRSVVSVILCLSSPMWSMKQTFLDTVLIAIITLRLRCCPWLRLSFSLFVAPYVTTLPGDLWAIIKSCFQRLCISLCFFHPSFHFTFFWAHQLCRETSNRALSCGWDLFTIQTLTICLCLLLPSLPLLTTTDLTALWDLTRKWNNMAAMATMDAIILLFSLPVCISLPSACISENEITEWKKEG